jgi:hypothetical protein
MAFSKYSASIFICTRAHDPSCWIAFSLTFAGQMRERIFHQLLMIAHTFLAHFDDPFCKPLASRHGLSVARKRTAGFLESIPGRVKCRPQNRDRFWIKELSARNGVIDIGHHFASGTSRGKTNATAKPICRRPFKDEAHHIVRLCRGAVGNVDYLSDLFLTDRSGEGEMRRARGQVDNIRTMPRLGLAGRGS